MTYKAFIASFILLGTVSCSNPENNTIANDSDPASTETKQTTSTNDQSKKNGNWKIDQSNSSASFTVTNFGKDVPGTIGGLDGTIDFDKDKPENARFDASAQVKTIDTDNEKRDKDLMDDKYFSQNAHPAIRFVSKKVMKSGNRYTATGELTIKGISKEIVMPFSFEEKDNKGIFNSNFTINRHDYDIGGNGPIMGDDIHVQLKVVANKK